MNRQFIFIAMMVVVLMVTLSPVVVMGVNPRDCYMWDQCRRAHEKEGTQVILWQCGTVPRGCFFTGKK